MFYTFVFTYNCRFECEETQDMIWSIYIDTEKHPFYKYLQLGQVLVYKILFQYGESILIYPVRCGSKVVHAKSKFP